MKDEQYGTLRAKAHRKKKVDVWTFHSPFADEAARVDGYQAVIEMRNGYKEGLYFVALSKHFGEPIKDSDIAKLRKRVEQAFQIADMAARKIKWEDWLEVELDCESPAFKNEVTIGLNVKWTRMKRGVHPETGEAFTFAHWNNVVVPFPNPKRAGEKDKPALDDKYHTRERDAEKQFSYIPETPANLKALKELGARIDEARVRLAALLAQDAIQATLANAGALRLEGPK